jgi:hypothetical protein
MEHTLASRPRTSARETTLDVAGGNAPIVCQDYGVPPPLTIHNGLAQFQLLWHVRRCRSVDYFTPLRIITRALLQPCADIPQL